MPCASAMDRVLQCVASFGLLCSVASTIAASFSGLMFSFRPLRGASSRMPDRPELANLPRHFRTELFVVAKSRASCELEISAAAPSTMLIRNATFWEVLPARSNASISSRSPLLIVICSAVCAIRQTQDTQATAPSPGNSEAGH